MIRNLLLFLLMATASTAVAQSMAGAHIEKYVGTPGTLQQAVGADLDASELVVTGTIDVRDLDFIADKMLHLSNLSLADATIAAWTGSRLLTGRTVCPANELPIMSLAGCSASSITLPRTLTSIADGALAGAAMASLEIPATVTRIGDGAFAGATALREITVPATVRTLGSSTFRGCTTLEKVYFNSPNVPPYAMAECPNLREVYLSSATTSIGDYALSGNPSLTIVSLSRSASAIKSIGNHAFHGTRITQLDLRNHSGLSSIGNWAFADCPQLHTLLLPDAVTELGEGVLFNAYALTSFTPGAPHVVGTGALKGARTLNILTAGGSAAERWEDYAFYGMTSLSSIHLPDDLQYIGDHAFDGCTALASMNAPAIRQVPALGSDVWGSLDRSSIVLGIPDNMKPLFLATPVWQDFRIATASVTTDMLPGSSNTTTLTAHFDGTMLLLEASEPMQTVRVVDIAGRTLHTSDPASQWLSIDASTWGGRVFVVEAIIGDYTRAVTKVAR